MRNFDMKVEKYLTIWKRRLEKNPSENTLATLKESIRDWEKNVSNLEKLNSGKDYFDRVEGRVLINRREKIVDVLKKLLAEYSDTGNKKVNRDGRKKGYDEMYPVAQKYFDDNKQSWIENYNRDKKPFIENEILPHLKEKFPNAEKYPSESHLRISKIEWD